MNTTLTFNSHFELISPVPEGPDCVHIEGVLSLTYGGHFQLFPAQVYPLVSPLAVVCVLGGRGRRRRMRRRMRRSNTNDYMYSAVTREHGGIT